MNKLHNKDFSIAFKTGSEANKLKFKKEAVQGELYFAVDSQTLYVAETTAGAIDATLSKFSVALPNPPFNISVYDDVEAIANIGTTETVAVGDIAYARDTDSIYVANSELNWSSFTFDSN